MNLLKLHETIKKICPGIVSVRESGVFDYTEDTTDAQKIAAQTVFDNWVDIPERKISCLQFWRKLTEIEQTTLDSDTRTQTRLILSAWNKAQELDYNDEEFICAMNYFVSIGLLTEDRRIELMS